MTAEQLIEKMRVILNGIDRLEWPDENGWWETSTGAEFGAFKLRQVEDAIREAFSAASQVNAGRP